MTSPVSSSSSLAAPAASETAVPQPPGRQAAPAQTEPAAKVDTVEISDRAAAAQVMLSGVLKAAGGASNPALAQLAQDVTSGHYHPPAEAVARSLVRYEGKLANVSSGVNGQSGATTAQ